MSQLLLNVSASPNVSVLFVNKKHRRTFKFILKKTFFVKKYFDKSYAKAEKLNNQK